MTELHSWPRQFGMGVRRSWLRSVALIYALVISAALCPAAAAAQDAAASAFRSGEEHFERGRYEEALVFFEQAFELSPHAAVRFNIAVCLERLGRDRDALSEYEQAATSSNLSDAERARAQKEVLRMRKKLESSEYASEPAAPADPGPSPISPETLAAPTPRPAPNDSTKKRPKAGALTWVGIGLSAIGTAGVVGFGVRTRTLDDRFQSMPTQTLADDGNRARNLTNASIAILGTGAALILIDLIRVARQRNRRSVP